MGDEYIIFLNFVFLEGDVVEIVFVMNIKGSKRGMDFICMVYDFEIKVENFYFVMIVIG